MILADLVFKDCQTEFVVRGLDVREKAGFKAAADAFFQLRQLARRTVGCEDDLFVVFIESVEGVEEFHLGSFFARDELNVVDEKHVRAAVFLAERLIPAALDREDELIEDLFTFDINDLHVRLAHECTVCDGVHEVRFAETGGAVDEEGIDLHPHVVGNVESRRMCETVRVAHDEVFEGVVFVVGETAFTAGFFRRIGEFCEFHLGDLSAVGEDG